MIEMNHEDIHNLHGSFICCPFCGSLHIHHESTAGARYARCEDCSASGGYVFDFERENGVEFNRITVETRWNKRYGN